MASRHVIRVKDETFKRLDSESRKAGLSRSQLANALIEEGLRMEAHPGIVFRPGPAGRRPALVDGMDVWEAARVLREIEAQGKDVVSITGNCRLVVKIRPK